MTNGRIGARVYALRKRQGLEQKQLAHLAHVPRPWLSLLETGAIKTPSAQRVQAVARALGVSMEFLLTGEDDGVIHTDPDKVGIGRQLLALPLQMLTEAERYARIFLLKAVPPEGEAGEAPEEKAEHDEPHAQP